MATSVMGVERGDGFGAGAWWSSNGGKEGERAGVEAVVVTAAEHGGDGFDVGVMLC
jgi:hypothetical protein